MSSLIKILAKAGLVKDDRDYHLVRASMTQRIADWVRGGSRERTW